MTDSYAIDRDDAWHEEVRREIAGFIATREKNSLPPNILGWMVCGAIGLTMGMPAILSLALVLRLITIGVIRWNAQKLRRDLATHRPYEKSLRQTQFSLILSGVSWAMLAWAAIDGITVGPAELGLLATVIVGVCLICATVGIWPGFLLAFAATFAVTMMAGAFIEQHAACIAIAALTLLPMIAAVLYGMGNGRQTRHSAEARVDMQRLREDLATAVHHAEFLSHHDPLTGLFNQRALAEDHAHRPFVAGSRGVLRIELDAFRAIVRQHGPGIGDDVLIRIGADLKKIAADLGDADSAVFRLDGEAFVLLLSSPDPLALVPLGDLVRERIARLFPSPDRTTPFVTASVGACRWPANMPLDRALTLADDALRQAKAEGGQRVIEARLLACVA